VIPRVAVDTLREITMSEQLTIDYGWSADSAIRCGCGAQNCRGWVVAADELHLVSESQQSCNTAV